MADSLPKIVAEARLENGKLAIVVKARIEHVEGEFVGVTVPVDLPPDKANAIGAALEDALALADPKVKKDIRRAVALAIVQGG